MDREDFQQPNNWCTVCCICNALIPTNQRTQRRVWTGMISNTLRWVRWFVGINALHIQQTLQQFLGCWKSSLSWLAIPYVECVDLLESMHYIYNKLYSSCWVFGKPPCPYPTLSTSICWNQCITYTTNFTAVVGLLEILPVLAGHTLRWVRWFVGINALHIQQTLQQLLGFWKASLSIPYVEYVDLLESMHNIYNKLYSSCWVVGNPPCPGWPYPTLSALICWNQCITYTTNFTAVVGLLESLPVHTLRWLRWFVGINA